MPAGSLSTCFPCRASLLHKQHKQEAADIAQSVLPAQSRRALASDSTGFTTPLKATLGRGTRRVTTVHRVDRPRLAHMACCAVQNPNRCYTRKLRAPLATHARPVQRPSVPSSCLYATSPTRLCSSRPPWPSAQLRPSSTARTRGPPPGGTSGPCGWRQFCWPPPPPRPAVASRGRVEAGRG